MVNLCLEDILSFLNIVKQKTFTQFNECFLYQVNSIILIIKI